MKKQIVRFLVYVLSPVLCLILLAQPVSAAVCASDPAVFLIFLAAAAVVGLNWLIGAAVHRKRPSLLVFAGGSLDLLLLVIIEYEALPGENRLTSVLAVIGGCLVMAVLFLLSFWLASRRSKPALSAAVVLRVLIGIIAFFMILQVIQDFKNGHAGADTWICVIMLLSVFPLAYIRRILAACSRRAALRRATGLAPGRIIRMIGETHLDHDDEPVTDYHARIQYSVDGILYETRAGISGFTLRRFGRESFIGREIPVRYDPENPGIAYTNRIDRHFFDKTEGNRGLPDPEEQPAARKN